MNSILVRVWVIAGILILAQIPAAAEEFVGMCMSCSSNDLCSDHNLKTPYYCQFATSPETPDIPYLESMDWANCVAQGYDLGECGGTTAEGGWCNHCGGGCENVGEGGDCDFETCTADKPYCCYWGGWSLLAFGEGGTCVPEYYDCGCCGGPDPVSEEPCLASLKVDITNGGDTPCTDDVVFSVQEKCTGEFKSLFGACLELPQGITIDPGGTKTIRCSSDEIPLAKTGPHCVEVEWCTHTEEFRYNPRGRELNCDSCETCEQTIGNADAGDTVKLTANIWDHPGTCIKWDNDGVIFDCESHKIIGTGTGKGIEMIGKERNVITACEITNFGTGIYLEDSSKNLVDKIVLSDNDIGIQFSRSSNNHLSYNHIILNKNGLQISDNSKENLLSGNEFCGNENTHIKVDASSNATGNDNRCDKSKVQNYHDGAVAEGCSRSCEGVYCSTCDECEQAIRNAKPGDTIKLVSDIWEYPETCIEWDNDNVIFDCEYVGVKNTINGIGEGYGIHMDGKTGNTIQNCEIEDFSVGIGLESSPDNRVTGNDIKSNTDEGISLDSSSKNEILHNEIKFNQDDGVYLSGSSENVIKENVVDSNDGRGIYLSDSPMNSIEQNTVYSSKDYGLSLFSSDNNVIENNDVCYNELGDIRLWASSATGDNNRCDKDKVINWHDDSVAEGCKHPCDKTCSTCEECEGAIRMASAGETVRLTADIENVGETCIEWDNENVILDCEYAGKRHKIRGVGEGYGIHIKEKNGNTIKNCEISNFYSGIMTELSENNKITSNLLRSNTHGNLFSSSENNEMTSNELWYNYYAVRLWYSDNNKIIKNQMRENYRSGVFSENSKGNTIAGNIMAENPDGINLTESSNNHIMDNFIRLNKGTGISLKKSSDNEIVLNKVESSEKDGISVIGKSMNNRVTDNTACYNKGKDIIISLDSSAFGDNNKCDNPDNFECTKSCQEVRLSVLFVPLKWTSSQEEFDDAADGVNLFIDDIPLSSCREKVEIKKMDIATDNFEDFDCHSTEELHDIHNFIISKGYNSADYDIMVGLIKHEDNDCYPIMGRSNMVNTIWGDILSHHVIPHEIGHIFGTMEEYCSKPAGSTMYSCNTGEDDIPNPLKAELPMDCPPDGSPASNGIPCCVNCDSQPYCCLGNKNSQGGRCFMSSGRVPGPRAFCYVCKNHLASIPKLQC